MHGFSTLPVGLLRIDLAGIVTENLPLPDTPTSHHLPLAFEFSNNRTVVYLDRHARIQILLTLIIVQQFVG